MTRSYQPIRPLFGGAWQLGVIENHAARPLSEAEIDAVCATLNALEPNVEWLLSRCEEYQRRAHEAEREVMRLRGLAEPPK